MIIYYSPLQRFRLSREKKMKRFVTECQAQLGTVTRENQLHVNLFLVRM